MSQAIEFLTPVGRFVQGNLFEGFDKDLEGKPLTVKTGPNAGQPRTAYTVSIAIDKNDPGFMNLWAKIDQAAKAGYPQFFNAQGQCINPNFAWKYKDGDSDTPDRSGIKPCDRPGFKGCHVLKFTSGFPFPVYAQGGKTVITDPNAVKRGYYIRIYGTVVDNKPSPSPGVYLNITGVEFIAYGEEIQTGPSGEDMFGSAPAPKLPPGASATPLTPTTPPAATQQPGQVPGVPSNAVQNTLPGAVPGTPQMTPAGGVSTQYTAPVQPVPGFVNAPAPQVEERFNINGVIYTRSQLVGYGWTPEQIQAAPRA